MSDPKSLTSRPNLTGQDIGDYRVLRPIGAGGMADVYLAEQKSLGRQVAFKVLHAELAHDANYVQRFQNEARAAAALIHPNIVQIYEVGMIDGIHFIAQEYVPGKNLGQVMERQGAFDPGLVLDILRQVVSALCKAHELSIVHRDIKPENILFSHSGEVKVADFGLARMQNVDTKTLTQVGVAMGTPLYMSPEQIEGTALDVRSDIYSLGATIYHLLSGQPPHTGDTALAIAVQHLNAVPRPLENVRGDIPSGLARLVHHMLSKKAEQRPTNPAKLLSDLRKLASEAEKAGWAEGPGAWSMVERIATHEDSGEHRTKLSELMKAASGLHLPQRKWPLFVLGLVVAILLGVFVARASRPRFLLAGSTSKSIPEKSSAAAQLYHAKQADTEAAWLAAVNYKSIDSYQETMARRGLIRCYLLVLENHEKALEELAQLQREADTEDLSLQSFILAGMCIANERLGHETEALKANERLDSAMRDELRRSEVQIYQLLEASQRRLLETP